MPNAFLATLALMAFLPSTARAATGPARSGPYALELVGENGAVLPTIWSGGQTFVLGARGQRYSLRIRNRSGQRVEFVAAVDGRDVLDGRPSDFSKGGYVVEPYGEVVVDGFRLNNDSVAAFRFSSVRESYAGKMGDARDVGVIGVAVFPEKAPVYVPPPPCYLNGAAKDSEDSQNNALGPAAGEALGVGGLGLRGMGSGRGTEAAPAPCAVPHSLAAPASAAKMAKRERPGLGTEFGEQRGSHVHEVEFARASSSPAALLSLRYDDCEGLRAQGVEFRRCGTDEVGLRQTAEPFRRNVPFAQPPPGWRAN